MVTTAMSCAPGDRVGPGRAGGRGLLVARAGRSAGAPGARDVRAGSPGGAGPSGSAPPRGDGRRAREVGRTCRPRTRVRALTTRRPNRSPGRAPRGPLALARDCRHGRAHDDVRPPGRPGLCRIGVAAAGVPGRWRDVARAANLLDAAGAVAPTVFAHDERARRPARERSTWARASPTRTAREPARGRRRRDPRRRQPVPARPRHPRAAGGGRRAPAALLRPGRRPRHRGPGDGGGHGGARRRRCSRCCGPGDEVVVLEPYYDAYAAVHRAGRGGCAARSRCASRSTRSSPAPSPPPSGPATRLILLNSPHNPTGHVLSAAELAEVARRRASSTTCWC